MGEIKEKGAFLNPYVIQMDKFADSMVHLSKTFFTLEGYKGTFSKEEFEEMFGRLRTRCVRIASAGNHVCRRIESIHIK